MSHENDNRDFPNTPLPKYPHLAGDDVPVWENFIQKHGSKFERFRYDVHVGAGLPHGDNEDPTMQDMWKHLTQKRIDVLGFVGDKIYVIEVKGRAGLGVIGQVLGYKHLLESSGKFREHMIPVVVAGKIEPDIESVLDNQFIKFYDTGDGHTNLVMPDGTLTV